jgi:hypothetical protein
VLLIETPEKGARMGEKRQDAEELWREDDLRRARESGSMNPAEREPVPVRGRHDSLGCEPLSAARKPFKEGETARQRQETFTQREKEE